jgi:hypothetical protein
MLQKCGPHIQESDNWRVTRLRLATAWQASDKQLKLSSDGNDSRRRLRGSCLGLVRDQLAQERNQHDKRNTDREAVGAKLREELRVPGLVA